MLIRVLYNHRLLQVTAEPSWLTIKGGRWEWHVSGQTPLRTENYYSIKYVEAILSQLPAAQLHLSTPIHAVWLGEGNTTLETATSNRVTFDHIIFACHSDDVMRILDAGSGATPAERKVLSAFRWHRNEVWLHSDESVCLKFLIGRRNEG